MDKIGFSEHIKQVVAQAAIGITIGNLINPPGRNPDRELLIQTEWFNGLNETNKEMVSKLIAEAVHESVCGFLCVLDGVRSITGIDESNNLQVFNNGVQLNSTCGEILHDIYKKA